MSGDSINSLRLIKTILIVGLLSGCSVMSGLETLNSWMPWYRNNQVDSVAVYVKPDPDLDHAVSIDVVFIYDDMIQTMLKEFDAIQWFEKKQALMVSYAPQLDVLQWQMVSGYGRKTKQLPEKHKDAIAVMAFAYYPSSPNTKAVLTDLETPWVVFDSNKLITQSGPPDFEHSAN